MVETKVVKKLLNVNQIEKMLQHFEVHKFIKVGNGGIQFGLLSESLQDFVRKEWLLSNLVASDWPAFQFSHVKATDSLKTVIEDVKNVVSLAPFSLVQVDNNCFEKKEAALKETTSPMELVSNQFKRQTGTILRNLTFCSHQNAVEIFHKKQRERKNWWRKFAALPGRFVTANVSNKEGDKSVTTEIQAEFPWGLETVETIKYSPDFSVKEECSEVYVTKRKKSMPHVVSCEAVLENITFTYLCDSYTKLDGNTDRDVLKLDRKLAPFKVSFAGTGSSSEIIKSLEEVSLLIAKQVRKLGISVLLLPDACTAPVEKQVLRNDAWGVPYTLLFNEKTLQVGKVALRSRDTTLQEDSHVSVISEYLGKLFK